MFENITVDELRSAGSVKWSTYPDAIGMFIAEMDFGVPDVVRRAIEGTCLGYLPAHQRDRLSQTAATYFSRYDWSVDPDNVRIVPDVLSALRLAIHVFSTGPIVVPTPAYMPFLTQRTDRQIIQVPSLFVGGRWELDLESIDLALKDGGLFILCNPWNPTGRVLERSELEAIEEIVTRRGAMVFSDEIHAPLALTRPHIPYASISEATASHTITATSASKGWNIPGLKCAQMVLPSHLQDAYAPYAVESEDPVGILGAKAACAVYTDDEGWLDGVKAVLQQNIEIFQRDLPAPLKAGAPEGTYISFIDASVLETEPAEFFRQGGVALTPGLASGHGFEGYVRMILATPPHILTEALGSMSSALAKAGY